MLFAKYLLTNVKSREAKTKLLYLLNAFRSIQKRITLELRELGSRDRVTFDCNVVKPKEKTTNTQSMDETDIDVNNENMTQTMNAAKKSGGVDIEDSKASTITNVVMEELVDINRYRMNNLFHNGILSTCPVIPKYHLAYGEPIERQEVSFEYETFKDADPGKGQAQRLLGRIDKIESHEKSGCLLVTDDFGIHVMYEATFGDMRALEEELLRTVSYYVNKVEPLQDSDLRNIFPSVDRFAMILECMELEQQFQTAKMDVIYCYLECYEHTCDVLEQHRLIQLIIDLMARRPRLNLAANHFRESYKAEVACLK